MRQETQGDVMMPADPAPYLVVVEADLAFALLDAALHRPARRAARGQRLLGDVGGGVGEEGLEFGVGPEAAAQDDPDIGAGRGARAGCLSATSGPLAPSFRRWRRQAVGGREAARARTATGAGAAASTRTRVRGRPCPVPAGTLTAGALQPDARRVRDLGHVP